MRLVWLCLLLFALPARAARFESIWLLGNGFHTSLVFRARDVPFRRELRGGAQADEIAIGWGASDDYRGPSTPLTVIAAIVPNRGALHVVPIRGPITRRFPHSDLVRLSVRPDQLLKLLWGIDHSFAFARDHRRIYIGRGVYPDGSFYASRERFYFPYVCNTWVALKLWHAGVRFCIPDSILAETLIIQARGKGVVIQHRDSRAQEF